MELHFIINPIAKNGYSLHVWSKVEKFLKEKRIPYHSYITKGPGDAENYVRNLLRETKRMIYLIAVGGDGTIHEVVNGSYRFNNGIVGCIPAGSGNDFSRGLKLPRSPKKAVRHLLTFFKEMPGLGRIDLGKFTSNKKTGVFVNNLGCGFDAQVVYKVNASRAKRFFNRFHLGKLTYVYYLIKELFHFKPFNVNIMIDDEEKTFSRVWLVTVANHPFFGGGMKILPDAQPTDGCLDMIIIHGISRLKILTLFLTVFWGGHTCLKGVTILRGKTIKILPDRPVYQHADGEYIGNGSVELQARANELPVLAVNTKNALDS